MARVSVTLNEPGYSIRGERSMNEVRDSEVRTDDEGNYRIENVLPGDYYVKATGPADGFAVPVYYPGVVNEDEATPVTVLPAFEAGGLDFSPYDGSVFSVDLSIVAENGAPTEFMLLRRRTD